MTTFYELFATAVPICGTYRAELAFNRFDVVRSVHMSASGQGKYKIYKNDELVATLFSGGGQTPKQAEYNLEFPFRYDEDKLYIVFMNRDSQPQDMYAIVQTDVEPRIKLPEETL